MTRHQIHLYMKKFLATLVLLLASYMVVADGMMTHFELSRCYQYMFNFAAIFMVLPLCVFVLFGDDLKEDLKW